MSQLITRLCRQLLVVFMGLAAIAQVHAHGSTEPQHGGQVQLVGDMSFELVNGGDTIEVYLVEHGELLDTSPLKARIKIKSDPEAEAIDLAPAGDNRFSAPGSLPAGSEVLVVVTMENGYSRIGANFTVDE
jgi:hypothetical protein